MFDLPKEERTLANYTKEAMCLIGRFGQAWMLNDDDVITNVVNAIIRAEWDFDPSRGVKRSTLRITYARYQIISEFRDIKRLANRPTHFSIDAKRENQEGRSYSPDISHIEDYREPPISDPEITEEHNVIKNKVSKMLKCKALTKKQRKYLKLHFLKGKTVNQLADKFECSKQAVSQVVQGGVKKLQHEFASSRGQKLSLSKMN